VTIWQKLEKLNPPPAVRRWAYGVTGAGLAVAGVYGVLDGEQIAAWGVLGAAVLGIAAGNTPTSGDER
jgi:hypothetical protein